MRRFSVLIAAGAVLLSLGGCCAPGWCGPWDGWGHGHGGYGHDRGGPGRGGY